jgi:hypothetical protein
LPEHGFSRKLLNNANISHLHQWLGEHRARVRFPSPAPISIPYDSESNELSRFTHSEHLDLALLHFLVLFKDWMESPSEVLTQYQFEDSVESNQIIHATINYNAQGSALNEVVGKYYKTENGSKVAVPFRAKVRLAGGLERKLLSLPQFEPDDDAEDVWPASGDDHRASRARGGSRCARIVKPFA